MSRQAAFARELGDPALHDRVTVAYLGGNVAEAQRLILEACARADASFRAPEPVPDRRSFELADRIGEALRVGPKLAGRMALHLVGRSPHSTEELAQLLLEADPWLAGRTLDQCSERERTNLRAAARKLAPFFMLKVADEAAEGQP